LPGAAQAHKESATAGHAACEENAISNRRDLAVPVAEATAPDRRFKLVEATMKRHQYRPDALIEVLHTAEEVFGYLDRDLLLRVARALKLPPSWVYGVATFYHFFSLAPRGKHSCVVCTGTACYVKGAANLLAGVERQLGIRAGQTTPDGKVSLLTARCLGTCGLAPVVVFDGSVAGHLAPDSILARVKGWQQDGPA
jgi:bidirectional [NiFe] hydrogenase diaphorase subunit